MYKGRLPNQSPKRVWVHLYPCILDTSSPKAAVFVVGRKTHNDRRFGKEEKSIIVLIFVHMGNGGIINVYSCTHFKIWVLFSLEFEKIRLHYMAL